MICRKKSYKIGDSIVVKHCLGGYQLPTGLLEGVTVVVMGMEVGYSHVEFQGRQFVVSNACVDSGWEYRLNGKWRDEFDPLVTMEKSSRNSVGKRIAVA
jgi:hypothetical protein